PDPTRMGGLARGGGLPRRALPGRRGRSARGRQLGDGRGGEGVTGPAAGGLRIGTGAAGPAGGSEGPTGSMSWSYDRRPSFAGRSRPGPEASDELSGRPVGRVERLS